MDRFPLAVSGGSIIVDKSAGAIQGPPIGTDTTGQGQEGAPCV
jgi:cytochrome b6-f complex iron-sulfur subunit